MRAKGGPALIVTSSNALTDPVAFTVAGIGLKTNQTNTNMNLSVEYMNLLFIQYTLKPDFIRY